METAWGIKASNTMFKLFNIPITLVKAQVQHKMSVEWCQYEQSAEAVLDLSDMVSLSICTHSMTEKSLSHSRPGAIFLSSHLPCPRGEGRRARTGKCCCLRLADSAWSCLGGGGASLHLMGKEPPPCASTPHLIDDHCSDLSLIVPIPSTYESGGGGSAVLMHQQLLECVASTTGIS